MSAQPERAEIEAELARLLASPDFEKNRGAAHFLKFVVEETLEGRGDRLKAFTIATQALDRKDDFDSQSNSAVRVQALRLRQLLQDWYEGPGAKSPVRIQIKPGSYKPVFHASFSVSPAPAEPPPPVAAAAPAMAVAVAEIPAETPAEPAAAPDRPKSRRFIGALALSVSTFLLALVGLMTGPASPPGAKSGNAPPIPTLRILFSRDESASKSLGRLAQALEVEFSAFDNVIVRKPDAETAQPPVEANAYTLALRPLDKDFVAELLRLSDRTVVWAEQFPLPADADTMASRAKKLAQTVGDAYGVIDLDALRLLNDFDGMPRGFNCTLNAFTFLKIQSLDRLRVARECLDIAVNANARDDDARALLAIVLVHTFFYAPPESDPAADLARAEKLAKEAFELAPLRARSYFARFMTLFARGRFEEAFADARTALALNGNSTLFARGIGAAHVLRGDVEAGMALLSPLIDRTDDSSAALGATALGHVLRGETQEAARLLARPGASERALALLLQLSLCESQSCARERAADLKRNFPGIAADVAAALDRMGMAEPVRARLLAGARAAGLAPQSKTGSK